MSKFINICEAGVTICKIKRADFIRATVVKSSNLIDNILVIELTKVKKLLQFNDNNYALIAEKILNDTENDK